MKEINLGRVLPMFCDSWNDKVVYDALDVVTYKGSSFIAKMKNVGATPDESNSEIWQLLASGVDSDAKGEVISNLGEPKDNKDATTKDYVDGEIKKVEDKVDVAVKGVDDKIDEAIKKIPTSSNSDSGVEKLKGKSFVYITDGSSLATGKNLESSIVTRNYSVNNFLTDKLEMIDITSSEMADLDFNLFSYLDNTNSVTEKLDTAIYNMYKYKKTSDYVLLNFSTSLFNYFYSKENSDKVITISDEDEVKIYDSLIKLMQRLLSLFSLNDDNSSYEYELTNNLFIIGATTESGEDADYLKKLMQFNRLFGNICESLGLNFINPILPYMMGKRSIVIHFLIGQSVIVANTLTNYNNSSFGVDIERLSQYY